MTEFGIMIIFFLLCIGSILGGWIDPDTQKEDRKVMSYSDGDMYHLVMSDEFNRAGRKFKDGDDPMWTGILDVNKYVHKKVLMYFFIFIYIHIYIYKYV
jgi:hypothetical protein